MYTRENAGAMALAFAQTLAGKPYVFGGTWPESGGTDCSGLCQWAYEQVGIALPRTSEEQCKVQPIKGTILVGDLVFFTGAPSDPPPGHVGLYVGRGVIGPQQHSWTPSSTGQWIFFNAPYTDDPFGIRYDYFATSALLYVTRPALLLPPSTTQGEPVDDLFITKNPNGPGDFFCAWSTRTAVGIPSLAVEGVLTALAAPRHDIDATTFAYFKTSNWKA